MYNWIVSHQILAYFQSYEVSQSNHNRIGLLLTIKLEDYDQYTRFNNLLSINPEPKKIEHHIVKLHEILDQLDPKSIEIILESTLGNSDGEDEQMIFGEFVSPILSSMSSKFSVEKICSTPIDWWSINSLFDAEHRQMMKEAIHTMVKI